MRSNDSARGQGRGRAVLAQAVAGVLTSSAAMCGNVRSCAAQTSSDQTNPPQPSADDSVQNRPSARSLIGGSSAQIAPRPSVSPAEKRAGMCGDVRQGAAQTRNSKTNPPSLTAQPPPTIATDDTAEGDEHDRNPELTTRQVAAARLLALGRCGRAVAAEVGVNEHTITRWRRTRCFDDEVRRQHALVLAEQVRQRRAEAVDAYAVVAERIVRKYGMIG